MEYRRAIGAAPGLPEVRVKPGELELKEQNWDAAAKLFGEEVAVNPSGFLARFGLAKVSFQWHEWEVALRYLNEAAKIRPEFFDPLPPFTRG